MCNIKSVHLVVACAFNKDVFFHVQESVTRLTFHGSKKQGATLQPLWTHLGCIFNATAKQDASGGTLVTLDQYRQ